MSQKPPEKPLVKMYNHRIHHVPGGTTFQADLTKEGREALNKINADRPKTEHDVPKGPKRFDIEKMRDAFNARAIFKGKGREDDRGR